MQASPAPIRAASAPLLRLALTVALALIEAVGTRTRSRIEGRKSMSEVSGL